MNNLEIEAQLEENFTFENTPLYKDSKAIVIIGVIFLILFWTLTQMFPIFFYFTILLIGTGLIGMLASFLRSYKCLHIFRVLLFALSLVIILISIALSLFIIYVCFYVCRKDFSICGFTIFKCLLFSEVLILPYYSLRSLLKMIVYSTQILKSRRRNRLLPN